MKHHKVKMTPQRITVSVHDMAPGSYGIIRGTMYDGALIMRSLSGRHAFRLDTGETWHLEGIAEFSVEPLLPGTVISVVTA